MKLIKPLILLLIFQNLAQIAYGQLFQQNLVYANYYMNPYLYNPSIIAQSGYTELALNYRQQWIGGVNGAPKTSTLNFQMPISYKAAFGVNLYNDKQGVLQTNTGMLSYAYQVYLGSSLSDIHKLAFGLSAGVTNSTINNAYTGGTADPTLNSISNIDGQFGMSYQFHNLKAGFSLPRLIKPAHVKDGSFTVSGFDPLSSTISTLSYNFQLNKRIAFEPIALYRTEVNLHWFEAFGVFKFDKIGWIGGSYRQDVGASGFIGFDIKQRLKVGYAYEFSSGGGNNLGNGTHEVQLILRLGKNKKERPQKVKEEEKDKVAEETKPEETKAKDETKAEEAVPEKNDNAAVKHTDTKPAEEKPNEVTPVTQGKDETVQAPVQPNPANKQPVTSAPTEATKKPVVNEQQTKQAPVNEEKHAATSLDGNNLVPGHYIVVGAFQSSINAKNYSNLLKRSGYPADVAYDPTKKFYIVHMGNVSDLDEAKRLRDVYRQKSRYSFKDTWILSIE